MKKIFFRTFVPFALLLLLFSLPAATFAADLTILCTSDVHGRVATDGDTIGLDVVTAIRKKIPDAILLDVGDFLHGLPIATLTQGRDVVMLMKQAGYTATAVGNHEFNYGVPVLDERAREAAAEPHAMRMLAANVRRADGGPLFDPWTVVEAGGLKVGLFGLTTCDTQTQAAPSAVEGLFFEDVVAAAKRAVRALKSAGCDLVVAMTHIETEESRALARAVPGIDVILGGHSHVVADETIGDTRLVAVGEYGHNVGVLEISRAGNGFEIENRLISKEESERCEPDAYVALRTRMIAETQRALLAEVVAHAGTDLVGDKATIRTVETNLGDLVADAVMRATGADAAIMNAGTIRAGIAAGDVTRGDVITAFPYANTAMSKVVTGRQLTDILEAAFSELPAAEGCFPQVAGMTVRVDRAGEPGARVTSVTMADGAPLDPAASYALGINDFIGEGGDGYPHLRGLPVEKQAGALDEIFVEFLRENGTEAYEGASPERIVYR